ncbi:MAG: M66 family metalloprotease [Myxococcota bacterium]
MNSFDTELQAGGLDPAPTDTITLVIVPIRYQADGSARVPDVTPGHIREIQEAMYALYPASDVVVRVEEPSDWFDEVAPNGAGWGNLLGAVSQRAAQADEAPNTYYYGMFDPTTSIQAYCRRGCILGLATLASIPEDFPRASIGLGFRGPAVGTLVHEVGHSHGLPHAPCGQVATFDRDYPYEEGEIGVWGYNLVSEQLREPSRHDMMGYCDPIWISDYNFSIIHDRILEVRDIQRSQPYEVTRLFVDEAGAATSVGTVRVRRPVSAPEMVTVDLYADGELVRTVEGAFEPFDHIGGGAVVLDEVLDAGLTAQVRR